MRDIKYFPLNIYNAREEMKMTRAKLAEKIDTSERIIYDYENGIKFPSFATLTKLAVALNKTLDYFVTKNRKED